MSVEPANTLAAKEWSVRIYIFEHDGNTRAEARLDTGAGTHLTGTGTARLSKNDDNVPEIGDELAAGRALSSLAALLLQAADDDVEAATHDRRDAPRSSAWSP